MTKTKEDVLKLLEELEQGLEDIKYTAVGSEKATSEDEYNPYGNDEDLDDHLRTESALWSKLDHIKNFCRKKNDWNHNKRKSI